MDDPKPTDDVAEQSAFNREEPPHVGAEEDRSRPADEDLTTEDLAEGGIAGA
jgi:hypothetical protein